MSIFILISLNLLITAYDYVYEREPPRGRLALTSGIERLPTHSVST